MIPLAFWYFSLAGGAVLLAYAIHRRDPVFILGQATGFLIYSRNLWFIYRPRTVSAGGPAGGPAGAGAGAATTTQNLD